MKDPIVSIIIPTYNVERYVEDCLDSVLNQTYSKIEVLIIDDGSRDATPYLLKSYEDKATVTLNKENAGQGAARNQGIKQAKGDYLLFVDADDWIEPDAVAVLIEKARRTELDLVRFNGQPFYEGGASFGQHQQYQFNDILSENTIYSNGELLEANRKSFSASPCLYLVKRSVLLEQGVYFPEEGVLHEDEYFTTKLFISVQNMAYVDRTFYHRRYRISSTMTETTLEHKNKSFKSYLVIFNMLEELYYSDYYTKEQKKFIKRQLISIFHGLQESKVNPTLKKKLKKLKSITLKDRLHIEISKAYYYVKHLKK